MRKLINAALLLVVMAAAKLPATATAPQKGLGMWVWQESAFGTAATRAELLDFCERNQIRHLDVHVRLTPAAQGAGTEIPTLPDAEALRELIQAAGTRHITIAALRGDPAMFTAKNHARALNQLRALIAFAKTDPENLRALRGIKYDVEPYLTPDWRAGGARRSDRTPRPRSCPG